jgi:hypothetical protein
MDKPTAVNSTSAKCICGQAHEHQLVATVVAGFWTERRFYECAECKHVFADDWSPVVKGAM